jgi:ABC-type multidrug transport system permease subunit
MFKNRLVQLILTRLHTYKSGSVSVTNSHKITYQSPLSRNAITGIISAVIAFVVVVIILTAFVKYLYRKRRESIVSGLSGGI